MKISTYILFLVFVLWCSPRVLGQHIEYIPDSVIYTKKQFDSIADISYLHYTNKRFDKSLETNLKILKKALQQKKYKFVFYSYSAIGFDYIILNDTIKAHVNFKKAVEYAEKYGTPVEKAMTYSDLAITSEPEKSKEYFRKSIKIFEEEKLTNDLKVTYFNFAQLAEDTGDISVFKEILNPLQKLVTVDGKPSLDTLDREAHVLIEHLRGKEQLHKKNYKAADSLLYNALNIGKGYEFNELFENLYELLAESSSEQGNYKSAYNHVEKYLEYRAINDAKRTSEIAFKYSASHELDEYKRDLEKIELKNELQAIKVKNKTLNNRILTAVSILFGLLLIYLIYMFKKRAELLKKLSIQNQQYLKAKERSEALALSKSKFFATVSHELRTPLYGVIGLSTLLLEEITAKKHRNDLESLKFSADYLLALINDVLNISKIDSNLVDEHTEVFNFRSFIQNIKSCFEYIRIQNNNQIIIDIDERIDQHLKGNTISLSQILMNLVGNATKFTENGTITIKAYAAQINNNSLTIDFDIIDNGIGIAQDKQKTIFDEFSQINNINTNKKYQGTGLGLPIVNKLIKKAGSTIKLKSELGKGSTFSFSLNFHPVEAQNTKTISVTVNNDDLLKNKHILVVDDNKINQIVTKKMLEKNDVKCTIANNGQEGVNCVLANKYDLVLMDINMPVMNGLKATEEIRKFSNIPIIALTAVEIEEMQLEIFESGMTDIIIKPYDINRFKETLCKNLVNPEEPQIINASLN